MGAVIMKRIYFWMAIDKIGKNILKLFVEKSILKRI